MASMVETQGLTRAVGRAVAVLVCLSLATGWSASGWADTVYKVVGDNGVVSFSDTPPANEAGMEILEIDTPPAPELAESAQEQLQAMRETTDRMVEDRRQRELHRAELSRAKAGPVPQVQVVDYSSSRIYDGSYPVYYPSYYPYPLYRPGCCGHRPSHPGQRPPHYPQRPVQLPADGIISPGHDYPASLIRRGYSPPVRAAFEK